MDTKIYSSWLIGSTELTASASLTVNGTPAAVAEGSYYLRDPVTAHSLIDAVQAAIVAVVPGSTVYVGQDRKVRIAFGASSTLAIPLALRAPLGFTEASYGATVLLEAESVSTLLWSPGCPETSAGSPVGAEGHKVFDRTITASACGRVFDVTVRNSLTLVDWSWSAVKPSRAWTPGPAPLPGEYADFFERIIVYGHRMKFYSQILEDESSATAVDWTTPWGPYAVRDPDYKWFGRGWIHINAFKTSDFQR